MKPSEFKKLIKESVKEAIQEELKEILLEAVKAPKSAPMSTGGYGTVSETKDTYAQPHIEKPKQLTPEERRNMFASIIGETATSGPVATAYAGNLNPATSTDTVNGKLPEGQVGLDQIMSMMSK